jgi:hypothetical protein
MSVRPSVSVCNNSAPTGRIFMKFVIWVFFGKLSRKFKFHEKRTKISGTLHEHRYIFLIITRSILLRMTKVSNKFCRGNQNTYFMFNNFFFKSWRLWDNVEKYSTAGQATDDNKIRPSILHVGYLRLQTHSIYTTLWFFVVTVVARTRLNVTLHVHCRSCWYLQGDT